MDRWPLTLRGTGAAALGVLCFVLAHEFKITELLYVSVLMLVVVAASIATLYLVRRSESVTRSFSPDVATVGEDVDVRAVVQIRSPLPVAQGRWSDGLARGVTGTASGRFPATASGVTTAGRAVELGYRVRAERRGVRQIGPLTVTATDPFGFARRRSLVGEPTTLTIAPQAVALSALTDLPGEAGGSMHSTTNQLGQGADNLIPRHYVPGDSMRRIHWRASAHRDELMVRQEEQETTPEAIVVLDRGLQRWTADAVRAPGEDPGFEAAVTACVSVAAQLVREGYRVSILDVDGTEIADSIDDTDSAGVERLLTSFATVTARRNSEAEHLVRQFAGVQTGPLVLVTGRFDAADADLLAPLPHHSALPVLLAVGSDSAGAQHDALARAAATGWRVASIPPDADLAAAWTGVVDRGGRRVGV
jgi:uncharacterized protein (DUF58 family)